MLQGDRPMAVDGHLTTRGLTLQVLLMLGSITCVMYSLTSKSACGTDASCGAWTPASGSTLKSGWYNSRLPSHQAG
jgi:hypothetical protein